MSSTHSAFNPMGFPPEIKQLAMAPRVDKIAGKTVYLVDCRFDDGDILIGQMQEWFSENMPEVVTQVRRKSGVYTKRDPELYDEIKEKGDAAIVGVGH
jgi:hypothetical protein